MIIYKDIINDDEVISDSYNLKEVDGVVYEADCAWINVGGSVNVDIGANASAEEADDDLDEGQVEKKIDVVHSFRLNKLEGYTKANYKDDLKDYMKQIKAKLVENGTPEAEVKAFEAGAKKVAVKVLGHFKDYDFYATENYGGMIVLLNFREDGMTPYVTVWKHGLSEMKV